MSHESFIITNEGSVYKIKLNGVLDEEVNFNKLEFDAPSKIEINFEELKSINSCGIRSWIKWIKKYPDCSIFYSYCPKFIIDQINMVTGFLPKNAKVTSFYVPYFNEEQETLKYILYTYGKEYTDKKVNPPSEIHDENGHPLQLDVFESKYFKFIFKD